MHRRTFLAGVGAVAASPRAAARRRQEQSPAFPHGVASGDPAPDAVVLWTRSEGSTELHWVVATDPDLRLVVAEGTVATDGERDWIAQVDATGLRPSTTYHYAFEGEAGRSPVGRTRTAPDEAVDRLRLGVVSCSRYATAGFGAYRALAEREVDLVVHLGDYIYEDGDSGARTHDPPKRCTTLGDYRRRYAQHRLDPDLQALHLRHPMVAIWDDHEIAGNAWREGARDHDDARDGSWPDRLAAAKQAHDEWVPRRGGETDARLWRSLPLGPLAELVLLDTRTERDRQVAEATLARLDDRERVLISAPQLERLGDRITERRTTWVLLANQVMFSELHVPVPIPSLAEAMRARGFVLDGGEVLNPDQWDGYPAERDRVRAFADERGGGVVVLTGDVHSSWAFTEGRLVELVAPAVSSASLGTVTGLSSGVFQLAVPNEGLRYVDADAHGYLLVDLTPERCTAEWWHVDTEDATATSLGTALATSPELPMELTELARPTDDPVPTTAAVPPPLSTADDRSSDDGGGGGGVPIAAGAAAVGVLATVAGSIALRRRRAT